MVIPKLINGALNGVAFRLQDTSKTEGPRSVYVLHCVKTGGRRSFIDRNARMYVLSRRIISFMNSYSFNKQPLDHWKYADSFLFKSNVMNIVQYFLQYCFIIWDHRMTYELFDNGPRMSKRTVSVNKELFSLKKSLLIMAARGWLLFKIQFIWT